jgi:hypothetical protein
MQPVQGRSNLMVLGGWSTENTHHYNNIISVYNRDKLEKDYVLELYGDKRYLDPSHETKGDLITTAAVNYGKY